MSQRRRTRASEGGAPGRGIRVERVRLDSLVPDERNARTHDEANRAAIRASLAEHGQVEPVVVQASTRRVIAGHGRIGEMLALGWVEVDAVLLDVDDEAARKLAIRLNRSGELAGWDETELTRQLADLGFGEGIALGFDEASMRDLVEGFGSEADQAALVAVFGSGPEPEPDPTYTSVVKAPVYEPKGAKPAIAELLDRTRTEELVAAIDAAGLDPETAAFLRYAAERHAAFHYRNVAEWYCHQPPEVQRLAEASGLVIVDYNRAIELGFVRLTDRLAELAEAEGEPISGG